MPEGNPAPPRPRRPDALISDMICYVLVSTEYFRISSYSDYEPSRGLLVGSLSFCASRRISLRSADPRHGGRIDSEISGPGPSILRNEFSSVVVASHLAQ